jgi:hypothetical protein
VIFYNNGLHPSFTRLHANIVEEDGAFTVSVRIFNHLNTEDAAWRGNCRDIRDGEPDGRIAGGPIFNSSELRLYKDPHVASSGRHNSLAPNGLRNFDMIFYRRADRISHET